MRGVIRKIEQYGEETRVVVDVFKPRSPRKVSSDYATETEEQNYEKELEKYQIELREFRNLHLGGCQIFQKED